MTWSDTLATAVTVMRKVKDIVCLNEDEHESSFDESDGTTFSRDAFSVSCCF